MNIKPATLSTVKRRPMVQEQQSTVLFSMPDQNSTESRVLCSQANPPLIMTSFTPVLSGLKSGTVYRLLVLTRSRSRKL